MKAKLRISFLLSKMRPLKLHLGCGNRNFGKDWIHIDRSNYKHIKSKDVINFKYRNVDLIYSSHMIAYFNRDELKSILKTWKKKLKVGGILRLSVTDFKVISKLYLKKKIKLPQILGPLFGKWKIKGKNDFVYMKTTYDYECLKNILMQAGYKKIKKWDWRKIDHGKFDDHSQAYIPHMDKKNGVMISLNIQAQK